jgi:hypothetical protein
MTELTVEKQTFQWSQEGGTTFQSLKEALCTTPGFKYLHPEKFPVDADVSNVEIGGCYHKCRTYKSR